MAISLGNVSTASVGEGTSGTIDANISGANNLIVVWVYIDDTSEGAFSAISSEDTDTFDLRANITNGNQNLRCYTVSDPGLNATNTITVDFDAATDFTLMCYTLNGVDTADVLDHLSSGNGTANGTITLTFSNTNSDGAVAFAIGASNNPAVPMTPFGSGQVDAGSATQGGAEKMSAQATNEIITASGSNNQIAEFSKSSTFLHAAIEINAEVVLGFPHVQVTIT